MDEAGAENAFIDSPSMSVQIAPAVLQKNNSREFPLMQRSNRLIAGLLVLAFTGQVLAHTKMTGTVPESGATLESSPAVIEIRFEHAVNLTSVVVVGVGKAERALAFAPTGSATTFKVTNPSLSPGRSEILWKALSSDGHVNTGTLIFIVKSAAAKTG
jgi:methionine-rich copper-binding protein CopC